MAGHLAVSLCYLILKPLMSSMTLRFCRVLLRNCARSAIKLDTWASVLSASLSLWMKMAYRLTQHHMIYMMLIN